MFNNLFLVKKILFCYYGPCPEEQECRVFSHNHEPSLVSPLSGKKVIFYVVIVAVVAVAAGLFAAFGPPGLYAKSESPEFCGSCHVMEARYEAWFHAGGHRRVKCVDCHLPNDSALRHLWVKAINGSLEFLAFHSGRVPLEIQLSAPGAVIVQGNCQRCHAETIARLSTDRPCWECHRRLSHKRSGAIATLTP